MRSESKKMRGALRSFLPLALFAAVGCSDGSTVSEPARVSSIVVQPRNGVWTGTLVTGQSIEMAARLLAGDGTEMPPAPVAWSAADTSVVRVSAAGVVLARGVGVTDVRAAAGGKVGRITVTVTDGPPPTTPVAEVRLSPAAAVLAIGQTRQYTARAYDENGNELTGRAVTWSSSAPQIASVSSTGLVTARAPGYTDIRAAIGNRSATVGLTVTTPEPVRIVTVTPGQASVFTNQYLQLSAETRDASGAVVTGRSIVWTSDDPAVAMVGTGGMVLGVARGTARIRATSEGVVGYADVTVRPLPSGARQTYALVGTQNLPTLYVEIGPTTWTDPSGTRRDAIWVVRGGALNLDLSTETWDMSFVVETRLLNVPSTQPPVDTRIVEDAGQLLYDFTTGAPILRSAQTGGTSHPVIIRAAGEFLIPMSVLGTASQPWVWVIE